MDRSGLNDRRCSCRLNLPPLCLQGVLPCTSGCYQVVLQRSPLLTVMFARHSAHPRSAEYGWRCRELAGESALIDLLPRRVMPWLCAPPCRHFKWQWHSRHLPHSRSQRAAF